MDYKLTPDQRDEVNALIERAQDDLEGVLYQLVGQRERLRDLGNELRHSCEQFGWTSAEHEFPRATKRIKAWDDFCANSVIGLNPVELWTGGNRRASETNVAGASP